MNNTRSRKWFIEINPNAECFNDFENILKQITSNEDTYAYIKHDKDLKEDGTPKLTHYHVVLDFANARTFQALQKKLVGAHIEQPTNIVACYQYLIHLNDKTKYQYNSNEIISNHLEYVKSQLEKGTKQIFEPDKILDYYYQGIDTFIKFYMVFGAQINPYQSLIRNLIQEINYNNVNEIHAHNYQETIEQLNAIIQDKEL